MTEVAPTPQSPIGAALIELSQDTGIYRDDLQSVIIPPLAELWGIAADDDLLTVRLKAAWQLERLIGRIKEKTVAEAVELQTIARVRYNLTEVSQLGGLILTRRVQRYYEDHGGRSPSTAGRRMTDRIVPAMEAELACGPLPPVPAVALIPAIMAGLDSDNRPAGTSTVEELPPQQPPRRIARRWWVAAALVAAALLLLAGYLGRSVLDGGAQNPVAGGAAQQSPSETEVATGTGAFKEMAGSSGARTYPDPHTLGVNGKALTPYQEVTVACRVFAPTMPSVAPGWWYRVTSPPWNGAMYAPANSFMNGDPVGVDEHHVDNEVPRCQ